MAVKVPAILTNVWAIIQAFIDSLLRKTLALVEATLTGLGEALKDFRKLCVIIILFLVTYDIYKGGNENTTTILLGYAKEIIGMVTGLSLGAGIGVVLIVYMVLNRK